MFVCPQCRESFRLAPRLAGKKIMCLACGTPVRVPAPTEKEPSLEDLVEQLERPKEEPIPASPSVARRAIGYVLALVAILAVFFFTVSSTQSKLRSVDPEQEAFKELQRLQWSVRRQTLGLKDSPQLRALERQGYSHEELMRIYGQIHGGKYPPGYSPE
jgi:hypothetical protein